MSESFSSMNHGATAASAASPIGADWLDRAGTMGAVVCAVHCLALPVVLAVAPVVSLGVMGSEAVEWGFVGLGALVGTASLVPSFWRVHGRRGPLLLFAAGLGALLVARLAADGRARVEVPLAVAGALIVASAHVLNRRLCRDCCECGAAEAALETGAGAGR